MNALFWAVLACAAVGPWIVVAVLLMDQIRTYRHQMGRPPFFGSVRRSTDRRPQRDINQTTQQ